MLRLKRTTVRMSRCCHIYLPIVKSKQRRCQGGGLKGLKPPLSDQNIDVNFPSFSQDGRLVKETRWQVSWKDPLFSW